MKDKRTFEISVWPYILIIVGIALVIASGILYINIPDVKAAVYSPLAVGVILFIVSLIMRPAAFKEIFASKKTLLWVNDALLILFIIGIAVMLTYIGFRHNIRYDFTYNQMFSLSEQTFKIVRGLDKDVKITAFYPQGTAEGVAIEDLLKEYKRNSSKLNFSVVDPVRDPMTTKAMEVKQVGAVIVQCGDNRVDLSVPELFYTPSRTSQNPQDKPKFTGEQAITSAIANVTSDIKKVVTLVKGHGEASAFSNEANRLGLLRSMLTDENIGVTETDLANGIASDVNVLVIVDPQRDYIESDIKQLENFVKQKDKAILAALDFGTSLPNLEAFIKDTYGVIYTPDLCVDIRGIQVGQPGVVVPDLADHEITAPLIKQSLNTIMYLTRTINLQKKDGMDQTVIVQSGAESFGKKLEIKNGQINAQDMVNFDEKTDTKGPVMLAVTAVATDTAKAVFFADTDLFNNRMLGQLGNRDLVGNSLNWCAGQSKMMSIRPRILEIPQIDFKPKSANMVFLFCLFAAPAFVTILGLAVYLIRRRVQ